MLSGLNLFAQQHWSFHLKSQNIQFYLKIQAIFLKALPFFFFLKGVPHLAVILTLDTRHSQGVILTWIIKSPCCGSDSVDFS